jgi:hypothetical protein
MPTAAAMPKAASAAARCRRAQRRADSCQRGGVIPRRRQRLEAFAHDRPEAAGVGRRDAAIAAAGSRDGRPTALAPRRDDPRRVEQPHDHLRRLGREQVAEHEAERVDIGSWIDRRGGIAGHRAELLGAHGVERTKELAGGGAGHRVAGGRRMRDAEIDHLRLAVGAHEDVAGLQITVDHTAGMPMGHRRAHKAKERHPLARGKPAVVSMPRDR